MDILDVLEEMIVQQIPQVDVVERLSRVRVPQMVLPLVDVQKIGLLELYSQRAMLYRWRDRDWEKRGLALPHKMHRTVCFRLRPQKMMNIVGDFMVGVDDASHQQLKPIAGRGKGLEVVHLRWVRW